MGKERRELYIEGVAIHGGPESCSGVREGVGGGPPLSWTRGGYLIKRLSVLPFCNSYRGFPSTLGHAPARAGRVSGSRVGSAAAAGCTRPRSNRRSPSSLPVAS